MDKNQLKSTATKVMARVNALGFTKDGQTMVVDQAYEVVAAAFGHRNQHAMRKQLQSVPEQQALSSPAAIVSPLETDRKWVELCDSQGWNDVTISVLMREFLQDKGLWGQFVAESAARGEPEENIQALIDGLEEKLEAKGYFVTQDGYAWSWEFNDDVSEAFASEDFPYKADAWQDMLDYIADQKGLTQEHLAKCTVDEQIELYLSVL